MERARRHGVARGCGGHVDRRPAAAQDAKGDKELTERAEKIDKAASRGDSGRVTAKMVDEWKGKTFDFGDGKGARALTAADVQNLRQTGLGYGETSILLAMANRTGQSPTAILQLRQSGRGWGQIAHQYHLKVGPVLKDVKDTEKHVDRVAKATAKDDKHDTKGEQLDKHEKVEKPEKVQRVERPERAEKPGR